MPDTPTKALDHSETRDLLQGARQNADTMVTECKFVPATALDGLAANLATLLEWSRLQDNDGIGFFFITNGAVYMDNIAPTRSSCRVQRDGRYRGRSRTRHASARFAQRRAATRRLGLGRCRSARLSAAGRCGQIGQGTGGRGRLHGSAAARTATADTPSGGPGAGTER